MSLHWPALQRRQKISLSPWIDAADLSEGRGIGPSSWSERFGIKQLNKKVQSIIVATNMVNVKTASQSFISHCVPVLNQKSYTRLKSRYKLIKVLDQASFFLLLFFLLF